MPSWDDYEVPHGGLDVAIPRNTTRILVQTVAVHVYALAALVYFSELLPLFPSWRRKSEATVKEVVEFAAQMLVLYQIPELLLVRLLSVVLFGMVSMRLARGGMAGNNRTTLRGRGDGTLARYAELVGRQTFGSKAQRIRLQHDSPMYRLGISFNYGWGCSLALTTYADRFGISYHAATDVGMLGIDHRNGWVGGVGFLAWCIALVYRLYIWNEARTAVGNNDTSHSLDDSNELDFEEATVDDGGIGGNKDTGLLSQAHQTSSFPTSIIRITLTFERKAFLFESFVAALIHQIPLAATHRPTTIFHLMTPIIIFSLVMTFVALGLSSSSPSTSRKAQLLLGVTASLVLILTAVQSTNYDLLELRDVGIDIGLRPWNFRWKVTDRIDRLLRWIG